MHSSNDTTHDHLVLKSKASCPSNLEFHTAKTSLWSASSKRAHQLVEAPTVQLTTTFTDAGKPDHSEVFAGPSTIKLKRSHD